MQLKLQRKLRKMNNNEYVIFESCVLEYVNKDRINDINNEIMSERDKLLSSKMKNAKTVYENLVALISKIGEKISIGRDKTLINNK